MNKLINKIFLLFGVLTVLSSCEKEEIRAVLNPDAKPSVSLSSQSLQLDKENAEANALTVSWDTPDFGFSAGSQYRVLIDKAGNNFAEAQVFTTGTEKSKSWTHKQLNNLLISMGIEPDTEGQLDVAVESILSDAVSQRSDIANLMAMPYLDKLDLSSSWGIVGSAAVNGWNGPDMPFYKTSDAGVYVAYVTLLDGEIKIRENNDWAVNYGDTGADGVLDRDGDNIAVEAGTYAVTFNENDLTYTIEKLSWGIVGSGAPNGWDGPDLEFMYDPSSDQWRAIATLLDGEIKIRQNNDWGLNYGDTGADGTLDRDGDNIAVSAGTYLVTLNLNDLTILIEEIDIPGIVGSGAPNGWDGPDVSLSPDFSREGVWVAYNVELTDGEIKFRMNNDWGVNFGDNGADGTLERDADNIAVSAGVYDIELDLYDPAAPTYTITAK
ncbi:SusE domain-containing protein [Jiulongibacter sp. NS-SX5]|uniref:SusE domain-containing protein n=1 Tax=Jiulongibacter sp. NS-SX5 TaxID=3463854 RepID=UPI00405917B5